MKIKVKCSYVIEVEVPDKDFDPKFAIEINGCPATGLVGKELRQLMAKHEHTSTCWACALGAKCQIIGDEYAKPEVTRENPPTDREILTLYSDDSPARPGNEPEVGDQDWTINFPLSDGRRLDLHAGKVTFNNFVEILTAYAVDQTTE